MEGLSRFGEGRNEGVFPDGGEVSMIGGEVKEGSKQGEGFRADMLQVDVREAIRAKGRGIFSGFDGISGKRGGEGGEGSIKGFLMYLAINKTGSWVLLVGFH